MKTKINKISNKRKNYSLVSTLDQDYGNDEDNTFEEKNTQTHNIKIAVDVTNTANKNKMDDTITIDNFENNHKRQYGDMLTNTTARSKMTIATVILRVIEIAIVAMSIADIVINIISLILFGHDKSLVIPFSLTTQHSAAIGVFYYVMHHLTQNKWVRNRPVLKCIGLILSVNFVSLIVYTMLKNESKKQRNKHKTHANRKIFTIRHYNYWSILRNDLKCIVATASIKSIELSISLLYLIGMDVLIQNHMNLSRSNILWYIILSKFILFCLNIMIMFIVREKIFTVYDIYSLCCRILSMATGVLTLLVIFGYFVYGMHIFAQSTDYVNTNNLELTSNSINSSNRSIHIIHTSITLITLYFLPNVVFILVMIVDVTLYKTTQFWKESANNNRAATRCSDILVDLIVDICRIIITIPFLLIWLCVFSPVYAFFIFIQIQAESLFAIEQFIYHRYVLNGMNGMGNDKILDIYLTGHSSLFRFLNTLSYYLLDKYHSQKTTTTTTTQSDWNRTITCVIYQLLEFGESTIKQHNFNAAHVIPFYQIDVIKDIHLIPVQAFKQLNNLKGKEYQNVNLFSEKLINPITNNSNIIKKYCKNDQIWILLQHLGFNFITLLHFKSIWKTCINNKFFVFVSICSKINCVVFPFYIAYAFFGEGNNNGMMIIVQIQVGIIFLVYIVLGLLYVKYLFPLYKTLVQISNRIAGWEYVKKMFIIKATDEYQNIVHCNQIGNQIVCAIDKHLHNLRMRPLKEIVIKDMFGNDVGSIIMLYLPVHSEQFYHSMDVMF